MGMNEIMSEEVEKKGKRKVEKKNYEKSDKNDKTNVYNINCYCSIM
tara:strand:- start:254 stop:391 length:138 start_codon:yes stop_codon:yes gene_type:complete